MNDHVRILVWMAFGAAAWMTYGLVVWALVSLALLVGFIDGRRSAR